MRHSARRRGTSESLAPAFGRRSSADDVREAGARTYDQTVRAAAQRSAQLDDYWNRIKANCALRVAPWIRSRVVRSVGRPHGADHARPVVRRRRPRFKPAGGGSANGDGRRTRGGAPRGGACRDNFATSAVAIEWTGRGLIGEGAGSIVHGARFADHAPWLREYTDSVRIAIDARKLHDFGIGTYIRNLIGGLAKIDQTTEYVLLCRERGLAVAATLGPNFRAVAEGAGHYSIERAAVAAAGGEARPGGLCFMRPTTCCRR